MELKKFKTKFNKSLKKFFDLKIKSINTNKFPKRVENSINYVYDYILGGGKRIRPYLVYITYKAFGGKEDNEIIEFSKGFELLHNFALIHDDIIDRGEKRHGTWTYHRYIQNITHSKNKEHIGDSQAILIGDIVFNWAYQIINDNYKIDKNKLNKARQNYQIMVDEVILGQMIDVDIMVGDLVDENILNKKNFLKTSSYSFIRPMSSGAILAGASTKAMEYIEKLGDKLGTAYQIRDDLQDIIMDANQTDKSTFSDIQDGQQTFFTNFIFKNGSEEDKKYLKSCLGEKLTNSKIIKLRKIFEKTGSIDYGKSLIINNLFEAEKILEKINFKNPEYKKYFQDIINMLKK